MYADPLTPLPAPVPRAARTPPPPRRLASWLVGRKRLTRRLAQATDVPLALLVAPAGYGKTTLLAQWTQADPRPCARLELRARENDPARLAGAVARALRGLQPPLVLVLDDAHVLRAPAALALVELLAAQLGPGSLLVLAARSEPPLPLGRLRAEHGVLELRTAELAMDEREGALLLRRAGLVLDEAQAAALVARTEGWPAGLQLAARAVRGCTDVGVAIDGFTGDDRLVADYVREELLSELKPQTLAFLLRTAPLDRLSGELCDAVLGCSGSGRVLRELARSNLLLVGLDRAERRFRYHTLLAQTLRAELRRVDPAWEREAHRCASAWHERQGQLAAAVDHAVAAGDAERAGPLLWRAAPALAFDGDAARLDGWLDRLGEEPVAARPTLALAAATSRLAAGRVDTVERLAEHAERRLGEEPAELRGALAVAAALVRATVARTGAAATRADAARAAEALGVEDGPWQALAGLLAGVADHLLGERAAAREALERGVRRAERRAPLLEVLCLAQLVLLALDRDDAKQAAALARRTHERIEAAAIGERPLCALAFAAAAFALAQGGQVEQARSDVVQAQALRERLGPFAPWHDAELCFALARAKLRLSRPAEARALLAEGSHALRLLPDAPVLTDWMDDAWARADAFAASAVRGPSMLTIAELRVLRFLPSHFSFREIAARLHVSANTVKTQAHAVYRKLDVSSRSEAVARARAVGLVDG